VPDAAKELVSTDRARSVDARLPRRGATIRAARAPNARPVRTVGDQFIATERRSNVEMIVDRGLAAVETR
jgi:hypothetical protein